MYVKITKIRLRKKFYNFGYNEEISMKNRYYNLKPVILLCESFKLVSFKRFEKEADKERHGRVGSGRAGSGRAGSSRISVVLGKRLNFCSMKHKAKINISRVMMLFCFPI